MKNSKGFSLIDVLAALFIVSIGVIGFLALAHLTLKSASISEARLIASGLAQEGAELVRDIREANDDWDDWNWYETVATSTSASFIIDYAGNARAFVETPLLLDPVSGLYQYGSGDRTIFYRKITLTKISYNQVFVVVEVKWQLYGRWYSLVVKNKLRNWQI